MSIFSRVLMTSAALAAAATVHADPSLKVSGMLDLGIYRDVNDRLNVGTIQRSNVAFSGTEDLGSGMSAFFTLSTRLDADTGQIEGGGTKPFWHGESTVGLKGAFGSVKMGRALDAMYSNNFNFDPWYYFNRVASPAWDLWHYNYPSDPKANMGGADYGRLDNGIFYESPRYNGLGVSVSGSPEKRTGDNNRSLGAALTYYTKDVSAMLSHSKNSAGATDVFVGLKGSIDQLTLMGAYDVSKTDNSTSTARAMTLGALYSQGALTYRAGWGQLKVDGARIQTMTGAGVMYSLSKRTSVYTDIAHKKFVSDSANVYGVGITHTF